MDTIINDELIGLKFELSKDVTSDDLEYKTTYIIGELERRRILQMNSDLCHIIYDLSGKPVCKRSVKIIKYNLKNKRYLEV